jgi:hypothetical protein
MLYFYGFVIPAYWESFLKKDAGQAGMTESRISDPRRDENKQK